jgi:hypothetical protein
MNSACPSGGRGSRWPSTCTAAWSPAFTFRLIRPARSRRGCASRMRRFQRKPGLQSLGSAGSGRAGDLRPEFISTTPRNSTAKCYAGRASNTASCSNTGRWRNRTWVVPHLNQGRQLLYRLVLFDQRLIPQRYELFNRWRSLWQDHRLADSNYRFRRRLWGRIRISSSFGRRECECCSGYSFASGAATAHFFLAPGRAPATKPWEEATSHHYFVRHIGDRCFPRHGLGPGRHRYKKRHSWQHDLQNH